MDEGAKDEGGWNIVFRRSSFVVRLDRQHLPRHLQPIHLDQHVVQLAAAGGLEDQLAVADQAEAAFGVGQRVAGDDLLDVGGLGGRLLQELEAGGHVGEEVLHRDQRAGRSAARLAADLAALGQADQRAGLLVARACEQRHLGDRCDAGQRLAAKAERAEMAQVVGGRQLARGVALESQGRLGRRDAAAVVLDADQPPAALAHLHADIGRARVQAVLDQLLDRRRGPLDHLARGDLVGDFGRKDVDGHGGNCTTGGMYPKPTDGWHLRSNVNLIQRPARNALLAQADRG